MKAKYLIIVSISLGLLLFLTPVWAQPTTDDWLPLQRVPGFLDDTFPPVMVVDQNKTVHAFSSQWVGEELPQRAIFYSQWSSFGDWTTPIDILLPPFGETEVYDAYLSDSGIFHLLFRSGTATGSSVYYSRAPLVRADRATAWSSPTLIGRAALFPSTGALIGDETGNLVIVYSGNPGGNSGLYTAYSADEGATWSDTEPIFLTFDSNLSPYSLQALAGSGGQAHFVWNIVDEVGVDQALYYTRVALAQADWKPPLLLAERTAQADFFGPSFPAIADNGRELVVMYNSGNPVANGQVDVGRPVQLIRRSLDGGDTWQPAMAPFPRHLGRSGSHALVVDSEQVMHALFVQRIEPADSAPIGGLWHSQGYDGQWSEPQLFDFDTFSGHDLRAVVSQGNMLLVTMREDPGVGAIGIWYTSTMLEAGELPVRVPPTIALEPTPTATSEPVLIAAPVTPQPSSVAAAVLPPNAVANASSDPARAILLALSPVLVMLVLVIASRHIARLRR